MKELNIVIPNCDVLQLIVIPNWKGVLLDRFLVRRGGFELFFPSWFTFTIHKEALLADV